MKLVVWIAGLQLHSFLKLESVGAIRLAET
ncbi:hypothetical protein E5S67_06072 [Microcoleus sp. IPMA8]|uniref:Uncharacterized protein n=1 Tax=Microcoleus asticus IPMA8 TaxID=2563858 RepID=A0ABX2D6M4_9CYAN|nr:hypothetical protein [Microcoleus asticus IPMA8]